MEQSNERHETGKKNLTEKSFLKNFNIRISKKNK